MRALGMMGDEEEWELGGLEWRRMEGEGEGGEGRRATEVASGVTKVASWAVFTQILG